MVRALWYSLAACGLFATGLASGCSGDPKTTGTAGAGGESGSSSSSGNGGAGGNMMMANVPDPGMAMNGEWTDVEPNDDPSHAVPVGILESSIWMGFADPLTAISSPSDVDYFVFRTGATATLANINMQICWSFAGNLLDMNLYDVVQNQKGMLIKAATSTNTTCETLIMPGEGSALLKADSVYLLEVVAAPGLNLAGDAGLYSA